MTSVFYSVSIKIKDIKTEVRVCVWKILGILPSSNTFPLSITNTYGKKELCTVCFLFA